MRERIAHEGSLMHRACPSPVSSTPQVGTLSMDGATLSASGDLSLEPGPGGAVVVEGGATLKTARLDAAQVIGVGAATTLREESAASRRTSGRTGNARHTCAQ